MAALKGFGPKSAATILEAVEFALEQLGPGPADCLERRDEARDLGLHRAHPLTVRARLVPLRPHQNPDPDPLGLFIPPWILP